MAVSQAITGLQDKRANTASNSALEAPSTQGRVKGAGSHDDTDAERGEHHQQNYFHRSPSDHHMTSSGWESRSHKTTAISTSNMQAIG